MKHALLIFCSVVVGGFGGYHIGYLSEGHITEENYTVDTCGDNSKDVVWDRKQTGEIQKNTKIESGINISDNSVKKPLVEEIYPEMNVLLDDEKNKRAELVDIATSLEEFKYETLTKDFAHEFYTEEMSESDFIESIDKNFGFDIKEEDRNYTDEEKMLDYFEGLEDYSGLGIDSVACDREKCRLIVYSPTELEVAQIYNNFHKIENLKIANVDASSLLTAPDREKGVSYIYITTRSEGFSPSN